MKQSECLGVNEQGHLTLGGCDTVELAEQYGTPLYLLDEAGVRAACRSYRESIERFYQGRGMVCYASKAFCCKEIYRLMDSEQMEWMWFRRASCTPRWRPSRRSASASTETTRPTVSCAMPWTATSG